jgi:hypothetical protein
VVIRRSDDGGATWTTPDGENTGLLLAEKTCRTAPTPVVEHAGRLWRAMSENGDAKERNVRAFTMSAPVDADLLLASNWSSSPRIPWRREFLEGRFGRWVEGNAVGAGGRYRSPDRWSKSVSHESVCTFPNPSPTCTLHHLPQGWINRREHDARSRFL